MDIKKLFDLEGKTAVVTGVSGNLGPLWVETLRGAGAVVIGYDHASKINDPAIVRLARDENFHVWFGDITQQEMVKGCARNLRPVSILVNNAGVDTPPTMGKTHRLEDIPSEEVKRIVDVNLLGTFFSVQAFLPLMEKGASIINIGSLYGSVSPDARFYEHLDCDPPFLKSPMYGATKAAVHNLTRYLAAHLAPRGIRVNTLSPGGVRGAQDSEFIRKFADRVPLGRMAEQTDLVGPLLFLASDASAYVTGQNLLVDGGFTAW